MIFVVSVGWLPNDYIKTVGYHHFHPLKNGWLSSSCYSCWSKNALILTKQLEVEDVEGFLVGGLNHPTWNICCWSNWDDFPGIGVKIKKHGKTTTKQSIIFRHFLSSFLDLLKMRRKCEKTIPQMDPNGGLMVILNGRNPWAMTN